jgi:hypothetical protein
MPWAVFELTNDRDRGQKVWRSYWRVTRFSIVGIRLKGILHIQWSCLMHVMSFFRSDSACFVPRWVVWLVVTFVMDYLKEAIKLRCYGCKISVSHNQFCNSVLRFYLASANNRLKISENIFWELYFTVDYTELLLVTALWLIRNNEICKLCVDITVI